MDEFKFYLVYFFQQLKDFNYFSIIVRILLSILIGTIIGLDRETKKHSAGVRTHSFVCLGATLTMLLGLFLYYNYSNSVDISRIGAQVISGIGFLGVGTIIISPNKTVRGLTTAASLWTTATIGLCIGSGFYFGAIFGCIVAVFLLKYLDRLDIILKKKTDIRFYYVECREVSAIEKIENLISKEDLYMFSFNTEPPKSKENKIGIRISIDTDFNHSMKDLITKIKDLEEVSFMHRIYI